MCHGHQADIKAYYIADDIYEIELPLNNLPKLGDIQEEGIIAYILISNGEEITIINNTQEYENWVAEQWWIKK